MALAFGDRQQRGGQVKSLERPGDNAPGDSLVSIAQALLPPRIENHIIVSKGGDNDGHQ